MSHSFCDFLNSTGHWAFYLQHAQSGPEAAKACKSLLFTYIDNVVSDPENPKYKYVPGHSHVMVHSAFGVACSAPAPSPPLCPVMCRHRNEACSRPCSRASCYQPPNVTVLMPEAVFSGFRFEANCLDRSLTRAMQEGWDPKPLLHLADQECTWWN